MEVKLKVALLGIGFPGDVVSVDDKRARLWVEFEDFADYVDAKKQKPVEAQRGKETKARREKAVKPPKVETADMKGGK